MFVNIGSWRALGLPIIKHLLDQFRIRLISQLINDISRVLQILLKYFNGALVLTFFVLSFRVLLAIFVLNLNAALSLLSAEKSVRAASDKNGSSL